jgi:phage-related minor tail protein
MNARGAAILAAEERARKAATVGIADQTAGLAQLIGKIDPSVAALERLDAMQAKLAAFRKSGAISGEDFAVYSAKIEEARSAVGKTATSMHTLSLNSALARRELGRMGTDIATGNFGRLSQTSLTLANYTGLMGLAFTAAGAAILGTVAVVGTFIAAAAKGWAETERLRVSIIATGGAAGVTADQLNAMAESVGNTTGEYGDARKAIELLDASGKVAGAGMGALATQAVNMSKVTGESIDKSVAKIIEIGDKPSEAIAKLNEQYHFLTSAQYAQIAALEAEGKVREASRLANQLDAEAMADRAKDVEDNAGWMVKSAHWVAQEWGKAWDAMKGVGRKESLDEQINKVKAQINELTGVHFVGSVAMPAVQGDDPRLKALRAQLAQLQLRGITDQFSSQQNGNDAALNAEASAAQRRLSAGTPADVTLKNTLNKLRMDRASALYGIVDPQQRALIEAQFANEVKKANDTFQSAVNKGAAKSGARGSKADPFASLNSLVQGAQVKDNTFGTAGQTSQVTQILAIVDAGAKLIASGQDVAAVQAKVAVGVAAVNNLYAKQAEQIRSQNVVSLDQYRDAVNAKLAADKMQLDNQVARIGMGQQEYERQTQLNKVYQDYARIIENLQKQRA